MIFGHKILFSVRLQRLRVRSEQVLFLKQLMNLFRQVAHSLNTVNYGWMFIWFVLFYTFCYQILISGNLMEKFLIVIYGTIKILKVWFTDRKFVRYQRVLHTQLR